LQWWINIELSSPSLFVYKIDRANVIGQGIHPLLPTLLLPFARTPNLTSETSSTKLCSLRSSQFAKWLEKERVMNLPW
jgi:hypothetical protein